MLETRLYDLLFINLRLKCKVLVKIFCGAFFIIAILTFFLDQRYTSTLSIMPNQSESSMSSLGMLVQDFAIDGGGGNFPISEIASSNSILDKIYNTSFDSNVNQGKINLADLLGTNKTTFISKIMGIITNKDINNPDMLKYSTIKKFKERLNIKYDRKTNITSISVTVEDPLASKQIADLFYYEISSFINKTINDSGKMKQNFLNERIQSIETELVKNEKILEDFLSENKSINQSPKLLQQLTRLQREVTLKETAYLLLKKELEIARIDEVKRTLKLIVIEKPDIPVVKSYPSRLSLSLSIAFFLTISFFFYIIIRDTKKAL